MKRICFSVLAAVVLVAALLITSNEARESGTTDELADGRFRVTVNRVIDGDKVLVYEFKIEARRDTFVRVVTDNPRGGGFGSATSRQSEVGGAPPAVRLTILGDHVRWEAGSTDALKFRCEMKGGGGVVSSQISPMPEGKELADVLSIDLKSGTYPTDAPVDLLKYQGHQYRLVIEEKS